MTQTELSQRLDRPLKTVNEIINGKAAITSDTAIQLERVLGISARFWSALETVYRDALARDHANRALEDEAPGLNEFPVADMVRHSLIERGQSKASTLENLLAFFGVSSLSALDRLSAAASYRSSPAFQASPRAVAVWLRWGEILASNEEVPTFDADRFRAALDEIRPLTRREPFDRTFEKAQAICARAGVVLLVVPELSGARLSGAARWVAGIPVIQLTLRYKTNDQFWFTFFHEAGHLLSRSRRRDFVDTPDAVEAERATKDDEERVANQFARDLLLSPDSYTTFVEAGDFTRESVRRYASEQNVAPGIVVGRLQRDGHLDKSKLQDLKRPVGLTRG
jgi:plasmid maintenance system antidote protein VapI